MSLEPGLLVFEDCLNEDSADIETPRLRADDGAGSYEISEGTLSDEALLPPGHLVQKRY